MKHSAIAWLLSAVVICCRVPAQEIATIPDESILALHFEPLEYPQTARILHHQGAVVVKVSLDKSGRVIAASAISGLQTLIPASVENAKKWRFQPNESNSAVIVYHFRFEGVCDQVCPSHFTFWPRNVATITTGERIADHRGGEEPAR